MRRHGARELPCTCARRDIQRASVHPLAARKGEKAIRVIEKLRGFRLTRPAELC
jgi:hypothetical protein